MKIDKKIYLHWSASKQPEGRFSAWDMDMSGDSFSPPLAVQTVVFEVEDFDPRTTTIELLRAQKKTVIEIATANARVLDQRIEELLALEAPVPVPDSVTDAEFPPDGERLF